MGTMQLSRFRANLLFDLRNRSDTVTSDGLDTTRLNEWINAAYLHITHPSVFLHRELRYRTTYALVNGQQAYTFSPDGSSVTIVGIRSLAHVAAATDDPTARRVKLTPRDEQWFEARSLSSSGPPRDYFVLGNTLRLSPVPGSAEAGQLLVLTGRRQPTLLSADADVTVLPSHWDEILLLASRWRAELHLGYRDLAEATKLDFAQLINEYQDFDRLHAEDWDWMADVRMSESPMERVG